LDRTGYTYRVLSKDRTEKQEGVSNDDVEREDDGEELSLEKASNGEE